MREIKFRAFEHNQKEMIGVDDIQFYRGDDINVDGVELKPRPREEQPIMINTRSVWRIADGEDVTLMQYTGLKDRNGVEIYEGDIVGYTTNYYGKLRTDNKQTIKWEDDMEHDGFGCPLATGFLLRGYDWEVIGNIYENPELLTNETTQ